VRLFGIGLMPVEEDYVTALGRMTTLIGEAAQALTEMFGDHVSEGEHYAKHIKSIEHTCDEITHDVSTLLSRSFITAIDREDIYALINALDDVVDLIEGVASAVIMYRVPEYTPHMRLFAGVIQQMAPKLDVIVPTIDRLRDVHTPLAEIHQLEREADDIYQEAIADLFRGNLDPKTIIVLKELYENFEATIDRCQNIGDLVERIAIKNT
jgi:predicted phosphate transport protein (TIGR00153 family)